MRTPRDVSGTELAGLLGKLGYAVTRQSSSHIRLTRQAQGEHHLTIPRHSSLRVGTLNSILRDVAEHLEMTKDELVQRLWG